jgi:2-polyprenyl-3-methyl-5-hydroxy-6-metoxy-1,4-benzoquinol methylase
MSNPVSSIRKPFCPTCGRAGDSLYSDLHDQLYSSNGQWNVSRCRDCAIAWLDPQPDNFDQIYNGYYTHQLDTAPDLRARLRRWLNHISLLVGKKTLGYPTNASLVEKFAAGLLGAFRPGREMGIMHLASVPAPPTGSVLDVGCGSGQLLVALRNAGWDVVGVEIDPQAVAAARATGIEIHQGTLDGAKMEAGRFSHIVLNHVIEHVPDPVSYLRECARLLAPDGQIIVATPNLEGFAHKIFGRFWRGLEIPRHLIIFSPKSLAMTGSLAGLSVRRSVTLVRGARFMYSQSARMRAGLTGIEVNLKTGLIEKIWRRFIGFFFQAAEWVFISFNPRSGDEILMFFSANREQAE